MPEFYKRGSVWIGCWQGAHGIIHVADYRMLGALRRFALATYAHWRRGGFSKLKQSS